MLIRSIMMGAAIVLLMTIISSPALTRGEEVKVIKIGTLAPEGSSWMKTLNTINAEVAEKTKGRVAFKIYAGGVLGDEKDMMRKMQIGQLHGVALTSGGLATLFQDIDVIHIPFFFRDYGEVDYVLKKMGPYFRKGLEEKGYVLLGWSEAGFVYLMSTNPITTMNELKKGKVWIWHESPMARAIFNEAGVSAIPLAVPDVLVGLQTGIVDVVYTPPTGAILLQWFTKVKYLTDVPLSYIGGGLVVRRDVFKKIDPADQQIILDTFQRHLDQLKGITRQENQEAISVMQRHGVKVVTPPQDQVLEFKKLSEKALSRFVNQTFSQKVLSEVTYHIEQYRKEKR